MRNKIRAEKRRKRGFPDVPRLLGWSQMSGALAQSPLLGSTWGPLHRAELRLLFSVESASLSSAGSPHLLLLIPSTPTLGSRALTQEIHVPFPSGPPIPVCSEVFYSTPPWSLGHTSLPPGFCASSISVVYSCLGCESQCMVTAVA